MNYVNEAANPKQAIESVWEVEAPAETYTTFALVPRFFCKSQMRHLDSRSRPPSASRMRSLRSGEAMSDYLLRISIRQSINTHKPTDDVAPRLML